MVKPVTSRAQLPATLTTVTATRFLSERMFRSTSRQYRDRTRLPPPRFFPAEGAFSCMSCTAVERSRSLQALSPPASTNAVSPGRKAGLPLP